LNTSRGETSWGRNVQGRRRTDEGAKNPVTLCSVHITKYVLCVNCIASLEMETSV